MKLTAKAIPWSSVVGTGVILYREDQQVVGQLALHGLPSSYVGQSRIDTFVEISKIVAKVINDAARTDTTND